MPSTRHLPDARVAVRTQLGAIFISLELSQSSWVVTSLSPGRGEKMSRHQAGQGDSGALLALFARLQMQCAAPGGEVHRLIVIQEAGLDGFWIHRLLEQEGIESHVVDPASITTSRRHRLAKTDGIDGEALVRALLAFKRGEPRVCAMVRPPSPEAEDRRQISRERRALTAGRVAHVNRIKGLLYAQGICDYEPLRKDRRARLEGVHTGDGRSLPACLKRRIHRELDRLECLLEQIREVEAERDAALCAADTDHPSPPALLRALRGIGAESAMILWSEGLYRDFRNRRQLAAYAGLAPTPWQSGQVAREQGVSKAGNARLRTTMIQLSWLWLRHQPNSTLAKWFHARSEAMGGRSRKVMIVALARKLLISLWRFVTTGLIPEGATMSRT